ncbi:GNAT family N-acetyltransferase [bacterium]|nr:GNAT family N-acetyltransferase [bacterium]
MLIRRAEAKDAEEIIRFNQAMAFETEKRRLPDEVISAGVGHIFTHPEAGFYLVAEEGGVTAGSLMVTYEWSDWRNGCFWWIQSVYVLPEFRRRGVYRRLYAEVKRLAAAADDCCGFRLYVEKENSPAQKTYEALGMAPCPYIMYEEARP